MNIRKVFPSQWLNAADLQGARVEVVISGCEMRNIRNPQTNREEPRLAVGFQGKVKKLLVNKTQAFVIAEIANSDETDDWAGTRIAMRPDLARNRKLTIVIERPAVPAPSAAIDTGE
jgi:hypothetical protein